MRSCVAGVLCDVAISNGFFFCGCLLLTPADDFPLLAGTYFLVDEDIVITVLVLVRKVLLDLSQCTSLFEELSVDR